MTYIIDSRIRVPKDYRPLDEHLNKKKFSSRYDEILHLSARNMKTLQNLKDDMLAANISHGILHAEYEYGDYADELNVTVAQIVKDHPSLFSGFGTISLEHLKPLEALKQLEQVKELGLLGINIQPSFFNISIDDRKLYPVYAKAKELDLSIAIHTGIQYSTHHPMKFEHPMLLDQVLCDFPELSVIACHGSWPWINEIVAVARRHPSLMVDFGGISPKYLAKTGSGWEMLYHFMNNLLSDQILFATDWPAFSMKQAVDEWRGLQLKDHVISKLFHLNVQKILKFQIEGGK